MSTQDQQHLRLDNGLQVTVIHDPQATHAAALIQLAAGSNQEPGAWPGLAHLLEHVLFAGSHAFQGEQRLMAWAPAQGARLNATTLANQMAWFFEIAPPKLADGLSRLVDMLAKPLLAEEAVAQEVAVIEAEYRMLATHSPTLCEAALSQAFVAPHPFADFHVGNLAHFGEDILALRQVMQEYHQRYFHAQNLHLWLQGPQSREELAALAEKLGQRFTTATITPPGLSFPRLTPRPERTFALQSSGTEQLLLSFPVTAVAPPLLSLLRALLTDQAPGSLLATLRERGWCDDIQLLEPYRSPQQSLLSVVFQLSDARAERGACIEALFCGWLPLLRALTPPQRTHYASLAQREFTRQPPLDQLRALAFGFPPLVDSSGDWPGLLAQIQPDNMTRLWVTPDADCPVNLAQGFTLKSGPINWPAIPSAPWPEMGFHQPGGELPRPALPTAAVTALQALPATGEATLLLSPAPGQRLKERNAALIKAALQPLIAECQHRGGELHFSQQQGIWLLQLSGSRQILLCSLDNILTSLSALTAAAIAQGERLYRQTQQALFDDIAIRSLLNRLPSLLQSSVADVPATDSTSAQDRINQANSQPAHDVLSGTVWQAALYGGDDSLHQALARLMSRFPATLQHGALNPAFVQPGLKEYTVATHSSDAAVMVFCPLPEVNLSALATWQVLAALFEPHFFQQLRVEKNIGYVVSCRFHRTAGQAGLLFALQSPTLQTAELFRHIDSFIHSMAEVIATLPPTELQEKILSLQTTCSVPAANSPAQCVQHWLYQQLNLPPLTREIYRQVRPEHLHQAQRYLSENPHRCWHLKNAADSHGPDSD
ncbi:pyrroloquinoline quinone biosynthesis protein PqqF [Erwinia amylovora]